MSDSNWGIRITAVGCVAAILLIACGLSVCIYSMGWSSGLHHAEANGYAAEYPADTKQRIDDCLNGGFGREFAKCIEEAITSSHDAQRSEQDLQAQRDMSEWAFWVMVIAGASLVVTTIGTGFLAWQVGLTREAVEETSKATYEMVKQNAISERSLDALYRPRVHIKAFGPLAQAEAMANFQNDAMGTRLPLFARVSLKNVGNEPLLILEDGVWSQTQIHSSMCNPRNDYLEPGQEVILGRQLGTGIDPLDTASVPIGQFGMPGDDRSDLLGGRVNVAGRVVYQTVLDDIYEHFFMVKAVAPWSESEWPSIGGNAWNFRRKLANFKPAAFTGLR